MATVFNRTTSENVPRPRASLADMRVADFPIDVVCPKLFISLGTTARRCVSYVMRQLESKYSGIPKATQFAILDADADGISRFGQYAISLGVDGAGTDPVIGREILGGFFEDVRSGITNRFRRAFDANDLPVAMHAKQAMDVVVIGTCGGTGGGAIDPIITLVHEISQRFKIRDLRVHVHLVGPEIQLRDIDRNPSHEQQMMIPDTYSQNLGRIYHDFTNGDAVLHEKTMDGRSVTIRPQQRVMSLQVVDQGNGAFDFLKIDHLVEMVGRALFQQYFTAAGTNFFGRYRDDLGTGIRDGRPE